MYCCSQVGSGLSHCEKGTRQLAINREEVFAFKYATLGNYCSSVHVFVASQRLSLCCYDAIVEFILLMVHELMQVQLADQWSSSTLMALSLVTTTRQQRLYSVPAILP